MSDLLCRVAKDATHLIVFPAVVGCSSVLPHSHSKDKDGEGTSLNLLLSIVFKEKTFLVFMDQTKIKK